MAFEGRFSCHQDGIGSISIGIKCICGERGGRRCFRGARAIYIQQACLLG